MTAANHLPGLAPAPVLPTPTAESDDWFTPQWILDWLPPIGLDPCWSQKSNVRPVGMRFSDSAFDLRAGQDGLVLPWKVGPYAPDDAVIYANPPYSDCARWVERCEGQAGEWPVVALIPAKPGERYWHRHVWRNAYVGFINGRVAFDTVAGKGKACGVFTSAIVVWGDMAAQTVATIRGRAKGHPQEPVWVRAGGLDIREQLRGAA